MFTVDVTPMNDDVYTIQISLPDWIKVSRHRNDSTIEYVRSRYTTV